MQQEEEGEREQNYLTCREVRMEPQEYPLDDSKAHDVLKYKDGYLRPEGSPSKNFEVRGNTLIVTFKTSKGEHGAYIDDLLAVCRDMAISDKRPDAHKDNAISYIIDGLIEYDKRAVKKHGYSGSKREREYVPEYVKRTK
jgi:hypothetical protein